MALVCPKCNVQNADNAYFCTACHAHIRSAFGAPARMSANSATQANKPVNSIFSSPVAVAEPEVALEESAPVVPDSLPIAVVGAEAPTKLEPAMVADVAGVAVARPETVALASGAEPEVEDSEPTLRVNQFGLQVSDRTFAEIDEVNILDQLAIVSDGKVIPLQLQKPDRPAPIAPTLPTPPAPGAPAAPDKPFVPRAHMNELPRRETLYPEVTLKDMFPALRALSTTLPGKAELLASGNTSGLRDQAVLPAEAKGWSWAGFVPGGAFGFVVGMPLLGVLGLLGLAGMTGVLLFWPLYILMVGSKGREYAWRNKRFDSVAQFKEMAEAWDKVGKVLIVVDVFLVIFILAMAGTFNP